MRALAAAAALASACATAPAGDHPGAAPEAWRRIDLRETRLARGSAVGRNGEIGSLRLVHAASLQADDRAFGGWSGVHADAKGVLAVSDAGAWLRADWRRDAEGRIEGLESARMAPLLRADGRPAATKGEVDAESLDVGDGSALVAFEQDHRLVRYALSGDGAPRPQGPASAPGRLAAAPRNGGGEALAAVGDGRHVLFTEDLRTDAGATVGFLGAEDWREIVYRPSAEFSATGADLSADGRSIYVIERAYSRLKGARGRIVRVRVADIESAGTDEIDGEELAVLGEGAPTDNYEAIAAFKDLDGRERLVVMSDDNFNRLQRTLLLVFEAP